MSNNFFFYRYKVTQRTHKCSGALEQNKTEVNAESGSSPYPVLPLSIQRDLQRLRQSKKKSDNSQPSVPAVINHVVLKNESDISSPINDQSETNSNVILNTSPVNNQLQTNSSGVLNNNPRISAPIINQSQANSNVILGNTPVISAPEIHQSQTKSNIILNNTPGISTPVINPNAILTNTQGISAPVIDQSSLSTISPDLNLDLYEENELKFFDN